MAKKKTNNRKKSSKLILDDERISRDKKAKTRPKKKPVKKADKYDDIEFINPQRDVEKSRSYPDISRPAPPKNQPRKKIKKKVNPSNRNQEFLGKNVSGSGVYEDEFYDNKSRKKKKPTSSSHTTRRSLKIFTYAAIVGVVVVLGITLSLTVFFKTAQYEVSGKTRYDKQDIINACGIKEGENIFLADKQRASENIINSFPYIAQADVSFGFPDKIVIEVTEGKASYMVKYAKKDFCVVSKEGRILKNSKKKISDLPLVKGLTLKSNVPGTYVEYSDESMSTALETIVESVDKCGLDKLTEINVSDKANLTFTYDGRILVKMGVPEDIDYKVRTANSIITEKLDPNDTGIIQGTLDVSQCKDTKKSYFNEKSIVTTNTENSTTETTVAVWDDGYDYNTGQDTYVDPYAGYDSYADPNAYVDPYAGQDTYVDSNGYYDESAGVVQ
ncbi:MAG: cell division protein FtsQ/DivIB [Ruminococcus sp.]